MCMQHRAAVALQLALMLPEIYDILHFYEETMNLVITSIQLCWLTSVGSNCGVKTMRDQIFAGTLLTSLEGGGVIPGLIWIAYHVKQAGKRKAVGSLVSQKRHGS